MSRLFFSLLMILGLQNVGSLNSLGTITKLKISHTHTDQEHHAHNHDSHSNDNHSHQNTASHTHEIVIVSGAPYVSAQTSTLFVLEIPESAHPLPSSMPPPKNPHLGSIFKPPIA